MAKYRVPLTGYASTTVDVETDKTNPQKIVELAIEEAHFGLCHHCASHGEVGDEWEPVTYDGKYEIYRLED
jgi:hypothetical protein